MTMGEHVGEGGYEEGSEPGYLLTLDGEDANQGFQLVDHGQASTQPAEDESWRNVTHDDIDMAAVDAMNASELKQLNEGQATNYYQAGDVVLIGDWHQPEWITWVKHQDAFCKGWIYVTAKGSTFDPGTLTIQNSLHQAEFKAAMKRISKKHVRFE